MQSCRLPSFTVSPQALSTHFPESKRIQGRCFQRHSQPQSRRPRQCDPVWTFHFLILDGCGVQTLKIGIHGKFYDIATGYVAQVPVRKSCESIRHLMIFRLWKLSMNNNTIVSLHESISQSFTHAAKLLKHACLYHCLCCIECHEGSDDLRTCSNAKSEILRSTDALSL